MGVMFAILLAIGLYGAFSGSDEKPEPTPVAKAPATPKTRKAPNSPTPPIKRAPDPIPAPSPPDPTDAAPPEVVADAAAPQGPFAYSLGEHRILLKGEGRRFLTVKIDLVMNSAKARDEVRRRRGQLVRMLFFLCSKRQAEGTMGSEGRARLKADLHERFGNAIKSGDLLELNFVRYEVGAPQSADAGSE